MTQEQLAHVLVVRWIARAAAESPDFKNACLDDGAGMVGQTLERLDGLELQQIRACRSRRYALLAWIDLAAVLDVSLPTLKRRCTWISCTEHDCRKFQRCGRCKVLYCSAEHQRRDWKDGHSKTCKAT